MPRATSAALLVLVGCNQVFGTAQVRRTDAAYFDAAPDAPFACPATGTVPAFSRQFRQIAPQDCTSYTGSTVTHTAVAACRQDVGPPLLAAGELGGKLAVQPELTSMLGALYTPRLSADGDRISALDKQPGGVAVALFHLEAGTWVRDPDIAAAPLIVAASELSHGPRAHLLIAYTPDDVRELEDQGDGTWLEVGMGRATFGQIANTEGIHLSGDALRAWYDDGGPTLFDRPDRDSVFTRRDRFGGSNGIGDAFMTDDCGSLYFSTLSSIWVAQRD